MQDQILWPMSTQTDFQNKHKFKQKTQNKQQANKGVASKEEETDIYVHTIILLRNLDGMCM